MRIRILVICLAGVLFCGACREAEAPAADEGLNVGSRAPAISGIDQDGVPLKLSDYRGKAVLLNFWADW